MNVGLVRDIYKFERAEAKAYYCDIRMVDERDEYVLESIVWTKKNLIPPRSIGSVRVIMSYMMFIFFRD
jgi:hypothetical protein